MARTETVTVIFTDLVGSTEQASRLGPVAADELRSTHFRLLRGAIGLTGGTEVKNLGDGLMVVFTSLSRALACAVAMQQATERHNRRADQEPLSIRIGMSTGETTAEADDYFGEPVIEASRLCTSASGGQIFATEIVKTMAGRHATHEFAPRGDFDLNGLSEPVSIFEVVWEPANAGDTQGSQIALPSRLTSASTESLFAFFGRSDELGLLSESQKKTANDRRLHVVLISGEPGIGKTALVSQAARAAHSLGANVLYGNCEEDLSIPYQPWVAALSPLIEQSDPQLITAFVEANGTALAELLPAVTRRLEWTEGHVASDPDVQRFLILESVVRFLSVASATAPIVLVLDDLHWADAATLQLLTHLVDSATPMSVLVIGTFRASDLSRAHPLTGVLAALHRQLGVDRVELKGLDDVEIIELLEAAAGHPMAGEGVHLAHALHRDTEGNPFFVVEVLRHLSETGAFVQEDGRWSLSSKLDELDLPRSVREVVGHRVARLGTETEHVLSLAAVIGPDFDLHVLAELLDSDDDGLLMSMERAVEAGLLSETDTRVDRYRFVHALIQQTLYQEISASRRQRAHLRVAEILERAGAQDEENLTALARHWMAASRHSDSAKAVYYARKAGDAALEAYAPVDAVSWYSQALELHARYGPTDERERCSLLVGLATAQRQNGQPEYHQTIREAGRVALGLADVDLLTRVALCRDFGQDSYSPADEENLQVLAGALDAVGPDDSPERAHLLAGLADEMDPRDVQRRVEVGLEALGIAHRLGDEPTLLRVWMLTSSPVTTPDTLQRRLEESKLALDLSGRMGDVSTRFAALQTRIYQVVESGNLSEVDDRLAEMGAIAVRTGIPSQRCNVSMHSSWRSLLAGHLDEAESHAGQAFELGTRMGMNTAISIYGAQLFRIRQEQGRLSEVLDLVLLAAEENPQVPGWWASLSYMHCQVGQHEEAEALLDADYANRFEDVPFDATWLNAMSFWAEVACDLKRRDAARLLYQRLSPYREQFVYLGAMDHGYLSRSLGRLATLLERYDEAERHLRSALDSSMQILAPYWIARTQLDLVDLLVSRGLKSDIANAHELVHDAQRHADLSGYVGLRAQIDRLLQSF